MQTSLLNRLRPAQKLVLPLNVGLWRSLVARPSGGRKVAGSSPASPTKYMLPLRCGQKNEPALVHKGQSGQT